MNWIAIKENAWPLFRAAMPFLIAALLAAGVNISPELQSVLLNNLEALMMAIGALAAAFPSAKAAVKYKESAD